MESRPTQKLSLLLLVVIIVVVAALGYVAVDLLLNLGRPFQALPGGLDETLRDVVNTTPTVVADPVTIVLEIRSLARLETAAYTVEKVVTAESGEDALSFLQEYAFQLLITDYRMKGIDGLQLLKRVKESHNELPVIIITGTATQRPEDFIDQGALDCLIKPISRERLMESVSKAILA